VARVLGTPLHQAVRSGETSIVRLLARKGSVDKVDDAGRTPLHEASLRFDPADLEILLKAEADINARDRGGRTVLDMVRKSKGDLARRFEKLLLARGARPSKGKTDWKKGLDDGLDMMDLRIAQTKAILDRVAPQTRWTTSPPPAAPKGK